MQHRFCGEIRLLLGDGNRQQEPVGGRKLSNGKAGDDRQRPKTAESSTLLRFPKPILWMAEVFHSGSGGTNCTAGGCCFNTPRGSVHSTASHLYMKVWVVERVLTAITSQPAGHTHTR